MKATVDIGEEDVQTSHQRFVKKRLFGGDVYETAYSQEHYHFVSTNLELSEEERSVIINYGLSNHVLDDRPKHSPQEVEDQLRIQSEDENLTHRNAAVREGSRQFLDDWMEKFKAERDTTVVADLLQQPFRRQYFKPAQAADYADRLKTKILPELSALLKKHSNVPKSETLEF